MGLIKSILKESTKLNFMITEESYLHDFEKLNKIFFNASPESRYYMAHEGYKKNGSSDPYGIIKMIKKGYINIYELKFNSYDQPKTEKQSEYYKSLTYMGKARSKIRSDLYWNAYNFFIERGYIFRREDGMSTYMHIFKLDVEFKDFMKLYDVLYSCKDKVENVILRCGDLDANRCLSELEYSDYLLLFPFDLNLCFNNEQCGDSAKIQMYTIEITDDGKTSMKNEELKILKSISKVLG